MKKRLLAALMAVAMVATQSIAFPVAAYADTWVVDSTYAGGGYWMDDEGYIVDGSTDTSSQDDVVTYAEDASQETGVEAQVQEETNETVNAMANGDATTGSIAAEVSGDPSQQQFTVAADGNVTFVFYAGSSKVDLTGKYTFDGTTLAIQDNTTSYNVILYSTSGKRLAQARSNLAHTYSVNYNLNGNVETVVTGILYNGEDQRYTADTFYTGADGKEYTLRDASAATQIFSYGRGTYSYEYVPYEPDAKTLTIKYVDENGIELKTESKPVTYKGESIVVSLDETLNVNGTTYTKEDPTTTITVDYDSTVLDYTVVYREYTALAMDPYSVKVQYVDGNGKVLGEDYIAVTAADIEAVNTIVFDAPKNITTTNAGTVSVYAITDESQAAVSHKAIDNGTTLYTISYTLVEENVPYTWSVKLASVTEDADGNEVSTVEQTIPYTMTMDGDSVTYEAPSSITGADGNTYYLQPGMSNTYTHKYEDKTNQELTIRYVPETDAATFVYPVSVQYMSVTTNEIIGNGASITMTPVDTDVNTGSNTGAKIVAADDTMSVNNVEYVKLQGQDAIKADYYSPQRTYTIYYRDAADEQNADTVVTQQQVITTDNVVTVPGPVETVTDTTAADTTAADTTAANAAATDTTTADTTTADTTTATTAAGDQTTVLTNNTTGDTTTLNEQGVPLADVSNQQATLEDQKTPLADAATATATTTQLPFIIGGAVAAAVLLGAILFFFYRRRKQEKQ